MVLTRHVTEDIIWVGGNERRLALFENIHPLYHGVSYNSYILLDKQTVLFDTADWSIGRQFIENVESVLNGRKLDYVVINHMEPDHAASLSEVLLRWPNVKILTSEKAATLMKQFGYYAKSVEIVKEGDTRNFGKHTVTFIAGPMVHWPDVLVTFDVTDGVLFTADAFGTFRSLDGKLFEDEFNFDREWLDDARRYYTNIVGKYGPHVETLLGKAAGILDQIKYICPLHGPVWRKNFGYLLDKYQHWASYTPEEKGVMVVFASMYGNTENVAEKLTSLLTEKGVTNTRMYDVSSTHASYLISDAFKYSHIVFVCVTYNLGIFPPMKYFIDDMKALNMQNRDVAIIENGSWAPKAASLITQEIESMKNMRILDGTMTVTSSLGPQNMGELNALADAIVESVNKE